MWLWGGIAGRVFGARLAATRRRPAARRAGRGCRRASRTRRRLAGARCARELPGAGGFYARAGAARASRPALALVVDRVGAGGSRSRSAERRAERALGRGRRAARAAAARGAVARQRRLALGRHRGRLLHAEQRHALVAFGPPQSGKSAGLAIPALLEWDGPAVASSIKTDLLAATLAGAAALGAVFVFDPFALAGARGRTPGRRCARRDTWDGALEVAWRLAAAGELDQRGVEGGDFWAIAAEQRLAPLLYAAAATGAGIDSVVRWAYGQGTRELDQALDAARRRRRATRRELADAHAAYDAVRAFEAQADRTRSLDRGDRAGAAARLPLRARRALGARRARSPPTGCSTRPRRCT